MSGVCPNFFSRHRETERRLYTRHFCGDWPDSPPKNYPGTNNSRNFYYLLGNSLKMRGPIWAYRKCFVAVQRFFATSKRSSKNIPPIRDGPEHRLGSCEPEQAEERLALQLPSYAQKEDRDRKMRGKGMPWLRSLG